MDSRKKTYSRISGAYPIPALSIFTSTIYAHLPLAQTNNPTLRGTRHTSNSVSSDTSHQAINPIGMLLCLAHDNRVALLQNLVDRDERLERLNLVGEDRLPTTRKDTCQPNTPEATSPSHSLPSATQNTYTFMPAQKAADDLWSHVYTMQLRTCFPTNHQRISVDSNDHRIQTQTDRGSKPIESTLGVDVRLGAVSSIASRTVSLLSNSSPDGTPGNQGHSPMLVAFRILMAKSASVLRD